MTGWSRECHLEPFAAAQGKLREGSVALGSELLRGVYPEYSECAQHDRAVTHTDGRMIVLMHINSLTHCPHLHRMIYTGRGKQLSIR